MLLRLHVQCRVCWRMLCTERDDSRMHEAEIRRPGIELTKRVRADEGNELFAMVLRK